MPERLAERITSLFPHTTKIDVKEQSRGGWRVFNTIYIEGGEEVSEVYTIVKAAADHRANETGRWGKFRAQVWRLPPGRTEHERHTVTFVVHDESEEDVEPAVVEPGQREHGSAWMEIFEAQQRLLEFSSEYSNRSIDRVLEQSKQDAERLNPMADVLHDFVGMYRDGLRMKADSVQELGELRLRQQVAEAQSKDSGKFWEMMAPAMQVAAMQMGQRFLGGQPKPRALPPGTAPAPDVRRHEAQSSVVTATHSSSPSTVARVAPSSPPADPPRSSPPVDPAAASVAVAQPTTLHDLAGALLDSMGAECLVQLGRMLDDQQITFLRAIARAEDDDTSAEAIAMLMQSLMVNPAAVLALQQALSPDQIAALQQIALLAQRHLEERAAERTEGAPPFSGDAPSAGKDSGS